MRDEDRALLEALAPREAGDESAPLAEAQTREAKCFLRLLRLYGPRLDADCAGIAPPSLLPELNRAPGAAPLAWRMELFGHLAELSAHFPEYRERAEAVLGAIPDPEGPPDPALTRALLARDWSRFSWLAAALMPRLLVGDRRRLAAQEEPLSLMLAALYLSGAAAILLPTQNPLALRAMELHFEWLTELTDALPLPRAERLRRLAELTETEPG